jgi:6-pyruvoyltetrahydropterin/6-carboxytetrahydropterin synthase
VRFCINDTPTDPLEKPANSFAGWPSMRGLGRYYAAHVSCEAEADPVTGYSLNIREVDAAVRKTLIPLVAAYAGVATSEPSPGAGRVGESAPLGELLSRGRRRLQGALPVHVRAWRLDLTPFYSVSCRVPPEAEVSPGEGSQTSDGEEPAREQHMEEMIVRQRFEFSAAHRLHAPELSAERNREVFGKCNNPSGHGHNYELEVAVRSPVDAEGRLVALEAIERTVDETVISRLDHKHLNEDVPTFAELIPSVEHIARVIHGWLESPIAELGCELDEVRVWETGKTACTYRRRRAPGGEGVSSQAASTSASA